MGAAGMGFGGGCGGHGGGGHFVGAGRPSSSRVNSVGQLYGYEEDWMAKTKKTLETELAYRGIAPETIKEVVAKVEEPSCASAVIIGILATALVCTLIFIAIWESTP
jgi:hypothetical protein